MPIIKRYPNRKLYDTEAKRYVTLEEIARQIRQGQQVSVVDHASGEDLTAVTLTQILLEQERRRGGYLPQSVLAGLVRAGGQTAATLRRALDVPLNLARQVDDEIERRLQALVGRGELAAEEGLRLRRVLLGHDRPAAQEAQPTDKELEQALQAYDLPSRDDVEAIKRELDELATRLDEVLPPSQP